MAIKFPDVYDCNVNTPMEANIKSSNLSITLKDIMNVGNFRSNKISLIKFIN